MADAPARLAVLDTSTKAAVCFVGELLQEQRIHRALEADVKMRDVTFSQGDNADASGGEAFEETSRVFLVTAESIERFRKNDVEATTERVAHQTLEASAQHVAPESDRSGNLNRAPASVFVGATETARAG